MKNFQLLNKEKTIGRYELEVNWVKLYNNDNKLVFEKNDNYFNSYISVKPNLYLEDYLKNFLKKA